MPKLTFKSLHHTDEPPPYEAENRRAPRSARHLNSVTSKPTLIFETNGFIILLVQFLLGSYNFWILDKHPVINNYWDIKRLKFPKWRPGIKSNQPAVVAGSIPMKNREMAEQCFLQSTRHLFFL